MRTFADVQEVDLNPKRTRTGFCVGQTRTGYLFFSTFMKQMVHPSIRLNLSILTSCMMQDVPFEVIVICYYLHLLVWTIWVVARCPQTFKIPWLFVVFHLTKELLSVIFLFTKRSPKRTSADSWYCWWFRNPKQPPGMYKSLQIMGFQLPIPQLVFTPDFWTINSINQKKQAIFVQQTLKTASSDEELSFKQLLAPRMGRVLPLWR